MPGKRDPKLIVEKRGELGYRVGVETEVWLEGAWYRTVFDEVWFTHAEYNELLRRLWALKYETPQDVDHPVGFRVPMGYRGSFTADGPASPASSASAQTPSSGDQSPSG